MPMLAFWGSLVERLGCKELKLMEKEDENTEKLDKVRLRGGRIWEKRDPA